MQQYELLCILPGTLAETDVQPVEDRIKSVITEKGGEVSVFADMGKNRLSYPMKHIRYGYFRICRFTAESNQIAPIEQKLRLVEGVLRALVQRVPVKNATPAAIQFPILTVNANRDTSMVPGMSEEAAAAIASESVKATTAATTVETKKIELADIDKKLDELLEKDMSDKL